MSLGYLISCIFNDYATATMIAPILVMPFMLFGGFFANLDSLAAWFGWIQWISPLTYANRAIMVNEFSVVGKNEYDIVGVLGIG